MTIERELLQRAKILLDCVCTSPVQKEIEELLAQPETEPVLINPFFQKTYCADDMGYILEDFYERLNTDDCLITVDENNLTQGIFEVTINWREESIYIY